MAVTSVAAHGTGPIVNRRMVSPVTISVPQAQANRTAPITFAPTPGNTGGLQF